MLTILTTNLRNNTLRIAIPLLTVYLAFSVIISAIVDFYGYLGVFFEIHLWFYSYENHVFIELAWFFIGRSENFNPLFVFPLEFVLSSTGN